MSGALAERVFATKMERIGFADVAVGGHIEFGVADVEDYPLFTSEVIHLMKTLIPAEQQPSVATSVIVTARKPA